MKGNTGYASVSSKRLSIIHGLFFSMKNLHGLDEWQQAELDAMVEERTRRRQRYRDRIAAKSDPTPTDRIDGDGGE